MLSLVFLLFFQMTAERLEGVQVRWAPIPKADSYSVSRQGGTLISWAVRTPAVTDTTVAAGTYVYTVAPVFNGQLGEITYTATITIPPQPDIQVTLKKGAKIISVPITRRLTDRSTTAPITVNKSTDIRIETK